VLLHIVGFRRLKKIILEGTMPVNRILSKRKIVLSYSYDGQIAPGETVIPTDETEKQWLQENDSVITQLTEEDLPTPFSNLLTT
jgi:hypothetical protein